MQRGVAVLQFDEINFLKIIKLPFRLYGHLHQKTTIPLRVPNHREHKHNVKVYAHFRSDDQQSWSSNAEPLSSTEQRN